MIKTNYENLEQESQRRRRAREKLKRDLGIPFLNKFSDDLLVEILANPFGDGINSKIYWERVSEKMQYDEELSTFFSPVRIESIVRTIAGYHNLEITPASPILECTFPLDGSRFTAIFPPVIVSPSFTIRKKPNKIFTLDEYVESGYMTEKQKIVIEHAIKHHKNIIIAGGTGSGKTTLVNAVIAEISKQFPFERIYICEDTSEIQCISENKIQCYTTNNIDLTKIVKTSLRYRPDRIIVGELRGGEALDLLDAWNTGHPGGVCTIHANSAKSGIERLKSLVGRNSSRPQNSDILPLIAEAIDFIVFIRRDEKKGRVVDEICEVLEYNQDGYIKTNLVA